jgi:transposase-like protein
MAEYPTTPFERAVDSAIARENARHLREDCPTCLGFRVVERPDGLPPRFPDRPRPTCPDCGGTGRRQ